MTTFDQILPQVAETLKSHASDLEGVERIVINRDLNGRVRLIVPEQVRANAAQAGLISALAEELARRLGKHGFPAQQGVLFEQDIEAVIGGRPCIPLEPFENVCVVDRLATEGDWASIAPLAQGAPRMVFFSIKGGVGRSTALAASAWALGQAGKRVLVLDLDLESPGLSSALLPEERRPAYGIADWLVEDLVDNGDAVLGDLIATSTLAHDGEIYVAPAHGRDPGEYVAKLGRVWMSKTAPDGSREPWSQRLGRLIDSLEARRRPDVILIDSRAGIDEVSSSCVTDLGAGLVLLFAIDGFQTWTGYRLLFRHWHKAGVAGKIRERLQLVGAMVPDDERRADYFAGVRERAWDAFVEDLYDAIPPGEVGGDYWNFEESDVGAPHYPWAIRWSRGFAALLSMHERFATVDASEVETIFGPLVRGLESALASKVGTHD
jgi:CobQ/CobB/MinD/ParA nucleotide binding domain